MTTCCYDGTMVRTQIQFEERQYQQIRTLAHRKRISISEAVRRLVRQSLREGLKQKQTGVEALLSIAPRLFMGHVDKGFQPGVFVRSQPGFS